MKKKMEYSGYVLELATKQRKGKWQALVRIQPVLKAVDPAFLDEREFRCFGSEPEAVLAALRSAKKRIDSYSCELH